jgi:2-oxo-hept-3-ene-1,7-dioate hydratase
MVSTDDQVARGMVAMLAARERELASGAAALGWKVGFNGAAVQAMLGLDGLVVGYLNDTTLRQPGATIDLSGWTAPILEVEVALRVGPDGAVVTVAPALELVDINLPFDDVEPILAADIFHRGVIFGPEQEPAACAGVEVRVRSLDDGAELATGSLVDDPGTTLEQVRRFLDTHGAVLEPGHRIIAGSLTPPVNLIPGQRLGIDFGALGSLEVTFAP